MKSELNSEMNEQQRKKERFFVVVDKYGRVLRLYVLNVASGDSQRSELVACAKHKTEKEQKEKTVWWKRKKEAAAAPFAVDGKKSNVLLRRKK